MTIAGFNRSDLRTIFNFFRMFLRDRFLGSRLGMVWAVANPVLMLSIYTYVFAFVLKSKLPGAESSLDYAIWLIAGFGPWLAMSDGISASASSVWGNAGLVKNMAFKTECLPLAAVLVGLVPLFVSIAYLTLLMLINGHTPSWHAVAVLPAILTLFCFVAALGLGLAALTTFYRDINIALPNLLMVLLFATPILYPPSATPEQLQAISAWNPFFIIAEWVRDPLVNHRFPPLQGLAYVWLLIFIIGGFTLAAFRRVKGVLHSAM